MLGALHTYQATISALLGMRAEGIHDMACLVGGQGWIMGWTMGGDGDGAVSPGSVAAGADVVAA